MLVCMNEIDGYLPLIVSTGSVKWDAGTVCAYECGACMYVCVSSSTNVYVIENE